MILKETRTIIQKFLQKNTNINQQLEVPDQTTFAFSCLFCSIFFFFTLFLLFFILFPFVSSSFSSASFYLVIL